MPNRRIPVALKKLQGDIHKERWPKNEPQPQGTTTIPKFLNRHARNEWKRIAPELERLGLLTKVDRACLAAYCQAYGRWVETEYKLNELTDKVLETNNDASNAYLLKTQSGNIIISPLFSVANRCLEQMRTFGLEFGLTPVSRSRINIAPKPDEIDPMEALLSGKGNIPEREE
jgi:P27 family predicted phage terminase small subunit